MVNLSVNVNQNGNRTPCHTNCNCNCNSYYNSSSSSRSHRHHRRRRQSVSQSTAVAVTAAAAAAESQATIALTMRGVVNNVKYRLPFWNHPPIHLGTAHSTSSTTHPIATYSFVCRVVEEDGAAMALVVLDDRQIPLIPH
uniref:Bm10370, isoform b n=1 Tax=Brugia malayi TaxID=6279 RepID=A0A1I9G3C6_BRUMA|nr:Bm10370, isoform b [Brugia malayi]